ncbi:hypothetical protein N3K63_08545 [Microbacterium sp. W1N]|uniref:hypothetical protein n=1 Tax=Microbacterium festucae TaxID=2977531 RepID=UPI0021C0405C|nr:hypothetical protein [Microbacterium festucae]MCT9820330.1 hypothetical protein [Microbacterium festucae]
MNTLLAPQRSAAPPEQLPLAPLQTRTLRTRPLDRVAMRVALALLMWSTRAEPERAARQQTHRVAADRRAREHSWLRAAQRLPLR